MQLISNPIYPGKYELISQVSGIDGQQDFYVIEPFGEHPFAANKIPPGTYPLDLVVSNEFSQNEKYQRVFCEDDGNHLMIRIKRSDNPNCQHEYLHVGNFAIINYSKVPDIFKSPKPGDYTNTLGCNLCGNHWDKNGSNGGPCVEDSWNCYERVYPVIRAAILAGNATWTINEIQS